MQPPPCLARAYPHWRGWEAFALVFPPVNRRAEHPTSGGTTQALSLSWQPLSQWQVAECPARQLRLLTSSEKTSLAVQLLGHHAPTVGRRRGARRFNPWSGNTDIPCAMWLDQTKQNKKHHPRHYVKMLKCRNPSHVRHNEISNGHLTEISSRAREPVFIETYLPHPQGLEVEQSFTRESQGAMI